jgi:hypothetical protein
MKIVIESTNQIVHIDGVRARIWNGRTESGVAVFLFVTAVAVHNGDNDCELERDLEDRETPKINGPFPMSV